MDFAGLFAVFVAVALLFGAGAAAMAIGVMFKRPCLRGSCGGPDALGPGGERIACANCPNRRRVSDEGA